MSVIPEPGIIAFGARMGYVGTRRACAGKTLALWSRESVLYGRKTLLSHKHEPRVVKLRD